MAPHDARLRLALGLTRRRLRRAHHRCESSWNWRRPSIAYVGAATLSRSIRYRQDCPGAAASRSCHAHPLSQRINGNREWIYRRGAGPRCSGHFAFAGSRTENQYLARWRCTSTGTGWSGALRGPSAWIPSLKFPAVFSRDSPLREVRKDFMNKNRWKRLTGLCPVH